MIDRPVTVIAEVTVNRACHSPTSSVEQNGEASSSVPATITRRPVTTVNCGTVSFWRQRCSACSGEGGAALLIQGRWGDPPNRR